MSIQNPMGLSGGIGANPTQPDVRNPSVLPGVATYPVAFDTIGVPTPVPGYSQPGVTAPQNGATVFSSIPQNPMQL